MQNEQISNNKVQSSSESSSSESDSDSDEEYEDGDQKGGAKLTDETDDSDDSDDSDDDDDDYDGDDNEIEIDDRTKGKRKDELFAEEVDAIKGHKHKGECHLQVTIQLLSFNWKTYSFFFRMYSSSTRMARRFPGSRWPRCPSIVRLLPLRNSNSDYSVQLVSCDVAGGQNGGRLEASSWRTLSSSVACIQEFNHLSEIVRRD